MIGRDLPPETLREPLFMPDENPLLVACKMAYRAQLHPRNMVSVLLLAAIHTVEPNWSPSERA